jgi:hypothetical protein
MHIAAGNPRDNRLSSSSVYLTDISNNLTRAGKDLESTETLILSFPNKASERIRKVLWAISSV